MEKKEWLEAGWPKVDEAAAVALSQVKLWERRIEAFAFVCEGLRDPYNSKEFKVQREAIHAALYRGLNRAYQGLFMWAVVLGDHNSEFQSTARRLAYKAFLREGMGIMEYLKSPFGIRGSYFATDEEEFRGELEELLKDVAK